MANKVVKLMRKYAAHGMAFGEVEVREPRFSDIMALGEPFDFHRAPNGITTVIENNEAIAAYVERCIVTPSSENLVELGVEDTRAVRGAVLDFFMHGGKQSAASPATSPSEQTI